MEYDILTAYDEFPVGHGLLGSFEIVTDAGTFNVDYNSHQTSGGWSTVNHYVRIPSSVSGLLWEDWWVIATYEIGKPSYRLLVACRSADRAEPRAFDGLPPSDYRDDHGAYNPSGYADYLPEAALAFDWAVVPPPTVESTTGRYYSAEIFYSDSTSGTIDLGSITYHNGDTDNVTVEAIAPEVIPPVTPPTGYTRTTYISEGLCTNFGGSSNQLHTATGMDLTSGQTGVIYFNYENGRIEIHKDDGTSGWSASVANQVILGFSVEDCPQDTEATFTYEGVIAGSVQSVDWPTT